MKKKERSSGRRAIEAIAPSGPPLKRRAVIASVGALAGALASLEASATAAPSNEVVRSVVGIRSEVPANARTATALGRERWGSGAVIDNGGLVLTLGQLILEASLVEVYAQDGSVTSADIVAFDDVSGFALVRALTPLSVPPAALGTSQDLAVGDQALAMSAIDRLDGKQMEVTDRREYAGASEYLLENAIFTRPPFDHPTGAPLVDTGGRLVGIGAAQVQDAAGHGEVSPGTLFLPIDALKPALGELLAMGRRDGPARPWLGIVAREEKGIVKISDTAEGGPAARAGLKAGDSVLAVEGQPVGTLSELYRELWSHGPAGAVIKLAVMSGGVQKTLEVASVDHLRWLRWQPIF